jgi:hypothetical protein
VPFHLLAGGADENNEKRQSDIAALLVEVLTRDLDSIKVATFGEGLPFGPLL